MDGEGFNGEGGVGGTVVGVTGVRVVWQAVEGGDDSREVITDGEGVSFVVGTVGVSKAGDSHGESIGVPGVGFFDGVGGEGSEDRWRGR